MPIKINGNIWKYFIVIAASVLVTVGVYLATVNNNTERIEKVEETSSQTKEQFLEFRGEMRTSIKNIEIGIGEIKTELKAKN